MLARSADIHHWQRKALMARMASLEDRIAAAETRLKELKERQVRIRTRERAAEAARERKADTRRKILVGALVTAKVEKGEFSGETLQKWLDGFLTRPDDRSLFALEPNGSASAEPPNHATAAMKGEPDKAPGARRAPKSAARAPSGAQR